MPNDVCRPNTWQIHPTGSKEWARCIVALGATEEERGQVGELFEEFLAALVMYFDLVRWGRARQTAGCGVGEQAELIAISHEQRLRVDSTVCRMQRLVQHLKTRGLPGGEAHRLDQYISKIGISIERLSSLKEYRTPQAFRAFARGEYRPSHIKLAPVSPLCHRPHGAGILIWVGRCR